MSIYRHPNTQYMLHLPTFTIEKYQIKECVGNLYVYIYILEMSLKVSLCIDCRLVSHFFNIDSMTSL